MPDYLSIPDAGVVKLVDTLDLGSSALWCAGSSPVPGINAGSGELRIIRATLGPASFFLNLSRGVRTNQEEVPKPLREIRF